MLQKTKAVALHCIKYSDTAVIATLYTETSGRASFLVPVSRSRKAVVKGVFFRPLSILELDFEFRPKASLQHVRDVRFAYAYRSLPFDPRKAAIGLFLSEVLSRVLKHEASGGPLFEYVGYSLQWLDAASRGFANFHLVFLTRLTRFLGFYPNVEGWHEGDYFDMANACFVPVRPFHHACLEPREAALIPLFMRMNYDSMRFFAMNRRERDRYAEVLEAYYRLHVPEFPELKSLDVLREVFA